MGFLMAFKKHVIGGKCDGKMAPENGRKGTTQRMSYVRGDVADENGDFPACFFQRVSFEFPKLHVISTQ